MPNLKKENTAKNIKNFIPYGTDSERDKMVKSSNYGDRLKMAKVGYGLDVLINDEDWFVRKAVLNYLKDNNLTLAEWCERNNKEIDLRKLAFSPYLEVRFEAVRLGYIYKKDEIYIDSNCKFIPYGTDPKKDKMVKSYYPKDRLEMAEEGYGLDILVNDENWHVRKAVARQGYGLGILVNDEDYDVQEAVVKQGYGLDVLIEDKKPWVRKAVLNYLKDNNLTLAEWCERNNKEIDLRKLAFSPYLEVRFEAVRSGYIYKNDEIYIGLNCKFIPYGTDPKKDKMVKSDDWRDRLEMAKEGYGLNILVKDRLYPIREAIARQGYKLNILVKDESEWVRKAVAEQGYGLDVLINDENEWVREAVAYQGYGLDVLINDENSYVQGAIRNYLTSHNLTLEQWKSNQEHKRAEPRRKVAEHGIALDVLINDEDYDVRKTVLDYLKTRFMTLSQWANYEEKSLDFNKLLNSPYKEVRLEAFRCVYKDNIDNLKSVGFPIDFKDIEDVKDHIFDDPTTCIKALRFLGDESVKSDEKYKEVLSILVSKSEELKEDHTSFPEKFNSFIKNGPYSVFKDFEKVRNNSLDINDPSISRFNTMKLEIQNLKNQISILAKENKSLQETLEKYVSVEKETDEKEL